jgi:hypothetical protein
MNPLIIGLIVFALLASTAAAIPDPIVQTEQGGAKVAHAYVADNRTVVLHVLDGKVERIDDAKAGENPFKGHESKGQDRIFRYEPPLATDAISPEMFTLRGPDGDMTPVAVHRKSKVNGVAWGWPEAVPTMAHTLFLELPEPLTVRPEPYVLQLDPSLSINAETVEVRMHPDTPTEAIKVNLVGYDPTAPVKSADLYLWRGDGGARDYAEFVGKPVWLFNPADETATKLDATVQSGRPRMQEFGNWDLTASDVWTCDLSEVTEPGTYQLLIEGVGFSRPFEVKPGAAKEPLRQSVIGMYYMRIGEPMDEAGHATFSETFPPPRQPLYMPEGNDAGVSADPAGFTVFLTSMGPDHPEWRTLGGDPWDNKDWSTWKLEGEPSNPNAYGGYSDAADWDRRNPSINIPLHFLLPYILLGEDVGYDDLDIAESGNGTPDLLDSAAWAVDYWRRLRGPDGGFSYGVNNPSGSVAYQAHTAPYMAHANAAMSAMLADAFRIAGDDERMNDYLATAKEAYDIGGDEDLDKTHGIGNNAMTGADFKATAAAYLYKLTGDTRYEDDFAKHVRTGGDITLKDRSQQIWAYAGYLTCAADEVQPINHPELLEQMKADVIADADRKHLANSERFPTRRAADTEYGWFQSIIEIGPVLLAHHQTGDDKYLRAMLLESDYSLGRNPLNLVLMTGDPFFSDRHIAEAYTTGRNDGFPGVHPGQTPYMNEQEWGEGFMADPGWMSSKGYPEWAGNWPHGEALWNNWYNYSNNEFTPQQSMAGKTALYAYLAGVLPASE